MADRIQVLNDAYRAYVDTYRGADGRLPAMMQLKLKHTMMVVAAAKRIASGEGFDARTAIACEAAALLHDTGRYEQLKVYNTFRDVDSVDHAVYSHDIVRDKGWLDDWEDKAAILAAVLYHNRRTLPEGLEPFTAACAKTVRDADKLDIFRVLEDQIATTDWRHDAQAFWNLPTTRPPSPVVAQCIRTGRPVDYQDIASLSDFVLIQIGWMISGLEYATTRRLCAARGHLAYRRNFLRELTDSPVIDELCDLAARALESGKEGE